MRQGFPVFCLAALTSVFLVWNCAKTTQENISQPIFLPDTQEVNQQSQDESITLSLLTEAPQSNVFQGEEPKIAVPEYIIDDFEHGIKRWTTMTKGDVKMGLYETESSRPNNTAIRIEYKLPAFKQYKLDPDSILIKTRKDAHFEKYKGIRFIAKANPTIMMSILLFETNRLRNDIVATEIWGKTVMVTPVWKQYRLMFKDLRHQEYYEQSYMGDDIEDLNNIRQVGFWMDNSAGVQSKTGEIQIDDVCLF